jgi:hypothetical protein
LGIATSLELNPTAHYVLAQTDERRYAIQVAAGLAETFHISEAAALQDTLELSARDLSKGLNPA